MIIAVEERPDKKRDSALTERILRKRKCLDARRNLGGAGHNQLINIPRIRMDGAVEADLEINLVAHGGRLLVRGELFDG